MTICQLQAKCLPRHDEICRDMEDVNQVRYDEATHKFYYDSILPIIHESSRLSLPVYISKSLRFMKLSAFACVQLKLAAVRSLIQGAEIKCKALSELEPAKQASFLQQTFIMNSIKRLCIVIQSGCYSLIVCTCWESIVELPAVLLGVCCHWPGKVRQRIKSSV